MAARIEARLAISVHPNPSPGSRRGRRGRGEESWRTRSQRRYQRRRISEESSRYKLGSRVRLCYLTWNFQGMSVKQSNVNRMRTVVDRFTRERREEVCSPQQHFFLGRARGMIGSHFFRWEHVV